MSFLGRLFPKIYVEDSENFIGTSPKFRSLLIVLAGRYIEVGGKHIQFVFNLSLSREEPLATLKPLIRIFSFLFLPYSY